MRRILGFASVLGLLALPAGATAQSGPKKDASYAPAKGKAKAKFDVDRYKSRNVHITMTVADPEKALARAERLVVKHGGKVQNSNSNNNNASISVKFRPGRMKTAVSAVRAFPGEVTNFSSHTNDYATTARQSYDRLERLANADKAVVFALKNSPPDHVVDGATMLRELTERERQNIESQLQSYREQSEGEQLHVNFSIPQ